MAEKYIQEISGIAGNGTTGIKIQPTRGKVLHALVLCAAHASGTNTLAALMALMTKIVVKSGTKILWELTGTQLRDRALLRGTTYDFNGTPNDGNGCIFSLDFSPKWWLTSVADMVALNPRRLYGDISIEITSTTALTMIAKEVISDDLNAPSLGHLTLEVANPIVAGTSTIIEEEVIEPRGRLIALSVYPDSTNSREITPVSLQLGANKRYAHENLTSAQNDEVLERSSLTPAASGRTANVYDIVAVKDEAVLDGWNLAYHGKILLTVGAAAAMAGTSKILIERLENNPN